MGKTVEDICNLMSKTVRTDITTVSEKPRTLSSVTDYNIVQSGVNYQPLYDEDELYDKLQRAITKELALALDKNSVKDIKHLKEKYGHLKEFSQAKNLLNRKCKEVWNVYNPLKKVPKEAMKSLGITNVPALEELLDTGIKFAPDNPEILTSVITSVIKNPNMDYTIEDIHKYLVQMRAKRKYVCDAKAAQYLIKEHNYSTQKLSDLGADKSVIKTALKNLPLKLQLKYYLKAFRSVCRLYLSREVDKSGS